MLSIIKIPEHGDSILASGSSKRTIGGDRYRVDVTSVAVVVCPKLALGELPNLANSSVYAENTQVTKWEGVRDLGDNF